MREAVIVSYARTGLAKSGRGGFNITPTVSIAAHSVKHAVAKAGIEAAAVEDVFMGNVRPRRRQRRAPGRPARPACRSPPRA